MKINSAIFNNIKNSGPAWFVGLIVALKSIIFSISYTSIIFSGILSPYFSIGIGSALISCVVFSIVISYLSRIPSIVSQPQHVICVLISIAAHEIANFLQSANLSHQIVPTTILLIAMSSFLLGLLFIVIGYFHLGRLIRYIPYPVIGGVIAGIGWLIMFRSLEMMVDQPFYLADFLDSNKMQYILPGVFLGVSLLFFSYRFNLLGVPFALILFLAIFYASFQILDIPITKEWLIHPLPSGERLWPPLNFEDLADVNWKQILQHSSQLIAMLFIGTVYYLLTTSGLEVITKQDLDIDRELKGTGLANVITSLGGGLPGYQTLTLSAFSFRFSANTHAAFFCAALALSALIFDMSFLNYIPKAILGGLVFFFGLALFLEWAFYNRRKISRIDYLLTLSITAVIAYFGFLQGFIAGIVIAAGLFLYDYSKINIIKFALSGENYQSNVDRNPFQQKILREKGDRTYIIKLQGYLFFGTAYTLLEKIKGHMDEKQHPLRTVVLDFHHVQGMDSSALYSFRKLSRLAKERSTLLVFSDVEPSIKKMLHSAWTSESAEPFVSFESLDYAVEWCENRILAEEASTEKESASPLSLKPFLKYFEKIDFAAGERIIRQGDKADELYIIDSGKVTVLLELPDGRKIRLRTMEAGTIIGELGFYLGEPRANSVIADEATSLYKVTKSNLEELVKKEPQIALAFHERVARNLAERVVHTNNTLQILIQ